MHRRAEILEAYLPEYRRSTRTRLAGMSRALRESLTSIDDLVHELRNLGCEANLMGDDAMLQITSELEKMLVSVMPRAAIVATIDAVVAVRELGAARD